MIQEQDYNMGRVIPQNGGEWQAKAYDGMTRVGFRGSSYYCEGPVTEGDMPGVSPKWILIAKKGEPFRYEDFTEEELRDIKQPIADAAEEGKQKFDSQIAQQQEAFNAEQAKKQKDFEANQQQMQEQFEDKQSSQQRIFNTNETARREEYERLKQQLTSAYATTTKNLEDAFKAKTADITKALTDAEGRLSEDYAEKYNDLVKDFDDTKTALDAAYEKALDGLNKRMTAIEAQYGDDKADWQKEVTDFIAASQVIFNGKLAEWKEAIEEAISGYNTIFNAKEESRQQAAADQRKAESDIFDAKEAKRDEAVAAALAAAQGIQILNEEVNRIFTDFGRYANPTEQVLQNATSGKYVDAVTGLAVNNSAYSISQPVNLLAGDILLIPSASAVLAACSVVSRIVTNTYDKAILYTYTYDEQGRIATAKADYNSAIYTAHYPDNETNTPDYWIYGAEHLADLPATHSVTESFYEPLVKQSVAGMPDEGYYVYLASRNMEVVISAFNATINGGKIIKVGWGIFKNIATNFVGHPQQRVIADYLCSLAERIAGVEDKLLNGLDLLKVGHLIIGRELGGINVNGNMCLQGAGAPAEAILPINWDFATYGDWKGIPQFIGQEYVDTTNKVCYKACGVDAVSDWKRITNA